MEKLILTRKDYIDGISHIEEIVSDGTSYLDKFKIEFPDGLSTVDSLSICRYLNDGDLDGRIRLMRLAIVNKKVIVTCPNGEVESFKISSVDDSFDGFPLFEKEPFALEAIADVIFGYLLKKFLRFSKPKEATAKTQTL